MRGIAMISSRSLGGLDKINWWAGFVCLIHIMQQSNLTMTLTTGFCYDWQIKSWSIIDLVICQRQSGLSTWCPPISLPSSIHVSKFISNSQLYIFVSAMNPKPCPLISLWLTFGMAVKTRCKSCCSEHNLVLWRCFWSRNSNNNLQTNCL